jgi:MYXO-CTERM domain-containing protein
MKLYTSILAVTLITSVSAQAQAYKLKTTARGATVRWAERNLTLTVVQCGDAAKDALLYRAVHAAAVEWSRVADLDIDLAIAAPGTVGAGYTVDGENHNVIQWSAGRWQHDAEHLALTFLRYDAETGDALDADIVINDAHFAWGDKMGTEGGSSYDLQNTITHELGHAIGVAHSEHEWATMYGMTGPDDTDKRFLDDDDVDAARALYGDRDTNDAYVPLDPGYGCDVTSGAARDPSVWGLFALVVFGLVRRRRPQDLSLALSAAALVAAASPAFAAESSRPGPDELVARADAVIVGQVVEQRVERGPDGVPVTISRLQVDRCVRGSCPILAEISQPGGELDGVGVWLPGLSPLRAGEHGLFALRSDGARWSPVGPRSGRLVDLRGMSDAAATERVARAIARLPRP